jgi:hypothetical protein
MTRALRRTWLASVHPADRRRRRPRFPPSELAPSSSLSWDTCSPAPSDQYRGTTIRSCRRLVLWSATACIAPALLVRGSTTIVFGMPSRQRAPLPSPPLSSCCRRSSSAATRWSMQLFLVGTEDHNQNANDQLAKPIEKEHA